MARGPKKPTWFMKKRKDKPKHNWSNDGGEKQRMLNMRRAKYFGFDLQDILEKTSNQDNVGVMTATITNNAARKGIPEAKEYIDKLAKDKLEPKLAEEIKKLLDRYSTYR